MRRAASRSPQEQRTTNISIINSSFPLDLSRKQVYKGM
jgi:hypothetical protein